MFAELVPHLSGVLSVGLKAGCTPALMNFRSAPPKLSHARSSQVTPSVPGSKATSMPKRGSPGISCRMKNQPRLSSKPGVFSVPRACSTVRSKPKNLRSGAISALYNGNVTCVLNSSSFRTQVTFPLYKAEIAPDLKFFGFDLTVEQARGTEKTPGFDDNLGWFFILQEIPGEPRFGMDVAFDPGTDGVTWDDLAWDSFGGADLKFIKAGVHPAFNPTDNTPDKWGTSSANMAYV